MFDAGSFQHPHKDDVGKECLKVRMHRKGKFALGLLITIVSLVSTLAIASASSVLDPSAPPSAVSIERQEAAGYEIIINLPAMTLSLYNKGLVTATFPIAIGNSVSPSQLGPTYIINKVANPTYYPPDWAKKGLKPIPPGPDNPVGTMWMGLERKGYGIHGTNNPASIGTAASGGCIRMYNADAEQLASIVPIGTPVNFVYEPLLVWIDPVTGWPCIQVYKDIYRIKQPSIDSVLTQLSDLGVIGNVHEEILAAIIKAASGVPEVVPMVAEVLIDDSIVITGYYDGCTVYAPVNSVVQQVGAIALEKGQLANVRTWSGTEYAPVAELARALGLLLEDDECAIMQRVSLQRHPLM
jgi:hypothetical protein